MMRAWIVLLSIVTFAAAVGFLFGFAVIISNEVVG